jgi:hypothetical protein
MRQSQQWFGVVEPGASPVSTRHNINPWCELQRLFVSNNMVGETRGIPPKANTTIQQKVIR